MTINDLEEMDIVLRRDGKVCWVLRNETTKRLQTFLPDMWGQHELRHYYPNFKYGKYVRHYSLRDDNNDILAVCKPRSKWKALQLMHDYEALRLQGNELALKEFMKEFNWINVYA